VSIVDRKDLNGVGWGKENLITLSCNTSRHTVILHEMVAVLNLDKLVLVFVEDGDQM